MDNSGATIQAFLARAQADPQLQQQLQQCGTADEVATLAASCGYRFSGSSLLRLAVGSNGAIGVKRIQHPGEYPGRYY
jgi:predicted ribosomally synthesized peptide with nif11-like leader